MLDSLRLAATPSADAGSLPQRREQEFAYARDSVSRRLHPAGPAVPCFFCRNEQAWVVMGLKKIAYIPGGVGPTRRWASSSSPMSSGSSRRKHSRNGELDVTSIGLHHSRTCSARRLRSDLSPSSTPSGGTQRADPRVMRSRRPRYTAIRRSVSTGPRRSDHLVSQGGNDTSQDPDRMPVRRLRQLHVRQRPRRGRHSQWRFPQSARRPRP